MPARASIGSMCTFWKPCSSSLANWNNCWSISTVTTTAARAANMVVTDAVLVKAGTVAKVTSLMDAAGLAYELQKNDSSEDPEQKHLVDICIPVQKLPAP